MKYSIPHHAAALGDHRRPPYQQAAVQLPSPCSEWHPSFASSCTRTLPGTRKLSRDHLDGRSHQLGGRSGRDNFAANLGVTTSLRTQTRCIYTSNHITAGHCVRPHMRSRWAPPRALFTAIIALFGLLLVGLYRSSGSVQPVAARVQAQSQHAAGKTQHILHSGTRSMTMSTASPDGCRPRQQFSAAEQQVRRHPPAAHSNRSLSSACLM
jgi:hypothetical protein